MNAFVSASRDIVDLGITRSGVSLSPVLFEHLTLAISTGFTSGAFIERMTVRYVEAKRAAAPRGEIRSIGDGCLVVCGMFPERVVRAGGSLPHYEGIGKAAYDDLGMVEAVYGWTHMIRVLSAVGGTRSLQKMVDLALAGSAADERLLSEQNVLMFRPRA